MVCQTWRSSRNNREPRTELSEWCSIPRHSPKRLAVRLEKLHPGSEYEDLGIKIKVTPTLHADHEVTLHLEFEIRALANAAVNGIPVLSNRTLDQTVRLKEDEPSILGGLTDREETRSITGLPGFAEIPGPPGYAFG